MNWEKFFENTKTEWRSGVSPDGKMWINPKHKKRLEQLKKEQEITEECKDKYDA